jgi:hypothetical protein
MKRKASDEARRQPATRRRLESSSRMKWRVLKIWEHDMEEARTVLARLDMSSSGKQENIMAYQPTGEGAEGIRRGAEAPETTDEDIECQPGTSVHMVHCELHLT